MEKKEQGQKPRGKKADGRQQLYAAKRDHDAMLKKYSNLPQHVQAAIVETRDLIWRTILSQEEREMPFFKCNEPKAVGLKDQAFTPKD